MGAYAYAPSNILSGLAASAFTWSAGANDATRAYLNDGWMDARYVNGSPAAGTLDLIIDLGSARALTGFAILNSNVAVQAAGSNLTITGADDAGISVNVVVAKAASTLSSAAPFNKDHVLQFATVTKRFWRLRWVTSATVTNFAIGELWAFNAQVQLSRKRVDGGGEGERILASKVDFYGGGSQAYRQGGPVRRKNLPFVDLSTSDRNELLTMWRAVALVTPYLWIESYEATALAAAVAEQEVIFGILGLGDFQWTEVDFNLFNPPELVIESLGREIGA